MNKEILLKKVADVGRKVAIKASGKSSLYLMYQQENRKYCIFGQINT